MFDIFAGYDGLLLVHPDWYTHPSVSHEQGIEQVYDHFRHAQEYCLDQSIPFMIAVAFTTYGTNPITDFGLSDCHKINKQNIVGHVSSIVGKKPEDISLLFGGFMFDKCVRNWVANLCSTIEDGEASVAEWIAGNQFWRKPERFQRGKIVYELTDRILYTVSP